MKKRFSSAFSILEMVVSFGILSAMMFILLAGLSSITSAWIGSESRVETYQEARGALELFSREISPAVVDTRMQFTVMPSEGLESAGATDLVPGSPAILWMAPLGKDGELRCAGYYLKRDSSKKLFRLKRIFVKPDHSSGYFPRMVNKDDSRDLSMRTDPLSAKWFLDNWDEKAFDENDFSNDRAIVSTAADGVIGLWVQCFDLLGNPIPWLSRARNHPSTDLIYNSAAFMQMATTLPFDRDRSTVFLDGEDQAMKANRVPAALEIVVVTVDQTTVSREATIPPVVNLFQGDTLDLEETVDNFLVTLEDSGVRGAEVFSARIKLVNGM